MARRARHLAGWSTGLVRSPQDDLGPDQAVNGLTVSRGVDPEPFTGTIAGVLEDGIAPGVDMILAELSSTAIDRNGIWAGMSGSPVYADADQTQLVGAVSYTLNEGSTTLAGKRMVLTTRFVFVSMPTSLGARWSQTLPRLFTVSRRW